MPSMQTITARVARTLMIDMTNPHSYSEHSIQIFPKTESFAVCFALMPPNL